MDKTIKNYLGIAIIAALLFSVIIGFWYVRSFSKSVFSNRNFTVNGEGKATAIPDIAQFSFGILTEGGKDLAALQEKNTHSGNQIIDFLKANGVEEKDIATQSYDITPRYQYTDCARTVSTDGTPVSCPPPEIVGYTIHQNVSVRIRTISKAGDIIAGVIENGANTVSGLSFTVDDATPLQNQAREKAIAQAREKAAAIAKASGFRLGKLISINDGFSPQPFSGPVYALSGKGGELSVPNIEPGAKEIQMSVMLTYEIR